LASLNPFATFKSFQQIRLIASPAHSTQLTTKTINLQQSHIFITIPSSSSSSSSYLFFDPQNTLCEETNQIGPK
jgi:hypothetical protein